jgi:hypothetical protein
MSALAFIVTSSIYPSFGSGSNVKSTRLFKPKSSSSVTVLFLTEFNIFTNSSSVCLYILVSSIILNSTSLNAFESKK